MRLPGDWPPESVIVDGQRLDFVREAGKPGWRYEGITLTTVVTVPRRPVTSRVEIDIHRQRGLPARRSELDGFAGRMTRLRGAYDAHNSAWPVTWCPESLIDAMQTGDRLSYHPDTIQAEIARFPKVYGQAEDWIQDKIRAGTGSEKALLEELREAQHDSKITDEQVAYYQRMLRRALIDRQDGDQMTRTTP